MLKHLFNITTTYLICHKKISSHIDKKKHMLIFMKLIHVVIAVHDNHHLQIITVYNKYLSMIYMHGIIK